MKTKLLLLVAIGMIAINVAKAEGPTAHLFGDAELCQGDSALITVELTGTAPWSIVYIQDNGDMDTINGIQSSPYTFWVKPSYHNSYQCGHVSDASGLPGTASGMATVLVWSSPIAQFSFTVVNSNEVAFTNESLNSWDYLWNFGDGGDSVSTEQFPTKIYSASGSYVVTLTASNMCGTDTVQDTVDVIVTSLRSLPSEEQTSNHMVVYYDLSGREVSQLKPNAVYIRKSGDGKNQKIYFVQ
jgi:PKD repeat protein